MKRDFIKEIVFQTSRSSGKGGQHVNKVETKVELRFNIKNSDLLNEEEKGRLLNNLSNRINKEGVLILSSDAKRSQLANKKSVIIRFNELIEEGLKVPKERIPIKPSKKLKEKRLRDKRIQSKKKMLRKKDASEEL